MPYALEEDKRARSARQYAADPAYYAEKTQRWKEKNPIRYAWLGQRNTSKQRGVGFKLTFEQFRDFWGKDFHLRGPRNKQLQMCRYGDVGPYEVGNIYIDTKENNKAGPRYREEAP